MPARNHAWERALFADWAREHKHDLRRMLRDAASHHGRQGGPPPRRGPPFGRGHDFPFGAPWRGTGRRAGRGDIRSAILTLLAEQPMHGYQVIQELERRSHGHWRPSPGSVYPTLQQLEDEGLVTTAEPEGGRRVYELSDAGREEVNRAGTAAPPWEDAAGGADEDVTSLRRLSFQVAAATWQVAQMGTTTQLAAAQRLLREARRGLYQLLAEDETAQDD
jgi:DNA-binding PadR family transcriptional regulator